MAVITYREALGQALAEERERDPDVFRFFFNTNRHDDVERAEVMVWLNEHARGKWDMKGRFVWLDDDADAVEFKLIFF